VTGWLIGQVGEQTSRRWGSWMAEQQGGAQAYQHAPCICPSWLSAALPAPSTHHPAPSLLPAARAYRRPDWVLPRMLSPAIPAFLIVTVYWAIGDQLDAQHSPTIAGQLMVCCDCRA